MVCVFSVQNHQRVLSLLVFGTVLLVTFCRVAGGSRNDCDADITTSWNSLFLEGIQYVSGTVETFVRAFCFGYGAHILLYLIKHTDVTFDELKARQNVSLTAGLAFGCLVYGGSMIFPASVRTSWFDYQVQTVLWSQNSFQILGTTSLFLSRRKDRIKRELPAPAMSHAPSILKECELFPAMWRWQNIALLAEKNSGRYQANAVEILLLAERRKAV